jgi:hypothetical protein
MNHNGSAAWDGWIEVRGTDGRTHRERRLAARDGGPDWIETDFHDGFGREIVRVLSGIDGAWTEQFDAASGRIERSHFGTDGCYYRETLQDGRTVRVRTWTARNERLSEDISQQHLRGLPALALTSSRPPVMV